MAIIVSDKNDKAATVQAFKYGVEALKYKYALEAESRIVEYLDLPNVEFRDARQIVDGMK